MWTVNDTPPATYPAPGFDEPGVTGLFYDGPNWQGKPTRVFAWIGMPERRGSEPVPAVVLVHGGGGSAFAHWVRLWNSRGYAAIAMDTTGHTPDCGKNRRDHHSLGGPPGWGAYDHALEPPTEQWTYHAVEAVLRGHSLLRARREVDSKRVGLTGISWGGYLTAIVAGVDPRYRFAAPVYGCGFIKDSPGLGLDKATTEQIARWTEFWDPSRYLKGAQMPMLWVNGTNDFAFTPPMWQESHRLPRGPKTLSFQKEMPHGHTQGEVPVEIHAFADAHCFGKAPLPRAGRLALRGDTVRVRFESATPLQRIELLYTNASAGPWPARAWKSQPLSVAGDGQSASGPLPAGVAACFASAVDARGCTVSTEWVVP